MRKFTCTEWNSAADLLEQMFSFLGRDGHQKEIGEPKEIERKWLIHPSLLEVLRADSDVKSIRERYINSVYLSVDPELRVRAYYDKYHREEQYKICYKGRPENGGLVRTELECECSAEVYWKAIEVVSAYAKPYIGSIFIPMKFWIITSGDVTYEIKSMDYGMEYQLEIESKTVMDAARIKLPKKVKQCILREVTSESEHKLVNYWKRTRQALY